MSMNLLGVSTIAGRQVPGNNGTTQSVNPATGELLEPIVSFIGVEEIDQAALEAQAAFDTYRATTPEVRAIFLGKIADNMEEIRSDLVDRAHQESGLTTARLEGELTRTTNQLRLFAKELRLGAHQEVRIDHALPDRVPAPAPDIRQRQIPLGPVAVFGASNFPLAFSVAGGDTASALAAGCPVIVKAHNSHAGTAELAGQAISKAVAESGLPAGTFSIIFGPGSSVGQALAAHPAIKAIAFTGSQTAGTALMHTAANRPEPIPVYAEMSSVNPVVMLPGSISQDAGGLATQFVASLTLSAGQFCTNPGLVLIPKDAAHISDAIIEELSKLHGQTMLSAGIFSAFNEGNERLSESGAELIAIGKSGATLNAPAPTIYLTNSAHFRSSGNLHDEVFGASALLVTYEDVEDLKATLESMQGQLTFTVQAVDSDLPIFAAILPILERKAGRVIFNGWPTGVEVNQAMVHGGPFPATSDPRATSVGTLAIYRFQRPVSYQGFPDACLPPSIQEENPWQLPRRIDGTLSSH
jgi:alpha-ketoglutaric semialdehyde dehydrogenase